MSASGGQMKGRRALVADRAADHGARRRRRRLRLARVLRGERFRPHLHAAVLLPGELRGQEAPAALPLHFVVLVRPAGKRRGHAPGHDRRWGHASHQPGQGRGGRAEIQPEPVLLRAAAAHHLRRRLFAEKEALLQEPGLDPCVCRPSSRFCSATALSATAVWYMYVHPGTLGAHCRSVLCGSV